VDAQDESPSPSLSSAGRTGVHKEQIREFEAAGCDQLYVHQGGPGEQRFLDFYAREIRPEFE
jgi:hypothetical protein